MALSLESGTAVGQLARGDDLPVGAGLTWRLKTLIASGRLAPGERLPGVRELAAGAGVNPNTARAVYRRLEEEGLTVSRQGLGTFVSPYAAVTPALEQFAAEVTAEATARGIDPRELARALYVGSPARRDDPQDPAADERLDLDADEPLDPAADERPDPAADERLDLDVDEPLDPAGDEPLDPDADEEPDEAAARASLRGQIARLEASLAPYPEAVEASEPPLLGPQPRLAGIAELEATRDAMVEQLKRARERSEARGEREELARLAFERASADPAAHRWEKGSREEMGEPGCGQWEVRPAWGPVGALMNWWRVKISSGCP